VSEAHTPNARLFPESERDAATAIPRNIDSMLEYLEDFTACHELYRHTFTSDVLEAVPLPTLLAWRGVAVREAAMQAYHFQSILKGFDGLLSRCATYAAIVDSAALRKAGEMFAAAFPNINKVRQGVAHRADHSKNSSRRKEHLAPITPDSESFPVYMRERQTGNTWFGTVDGKWVSFSLTQGVVNALAGTFDLVLEAFEPVNLWLDHSVEIYDCQRRMRRKLHPADG
jgi:hypothetical protein